ncbi:MULTISPECIES: hypothetical protein [unclassified Polaribacter]|uniref:hypothetical protein n=1 Tax=unclassified Polaribacter TaxID=196858 RepID=UPI0011BFAE5A|nr:MULTISPECIES: hypothetical protein [unclassified Polaribacter]TXD53302.1 hypothetical protein ES043_04630 [Polaribacter sp. IC063]TXD60245.1 hypothetical protein ES044_08025 [Polaribacter sp. IC066]
MNFNAKIFTRVFKINLTKTAIIDLDWKLPTLNFMYFDINEGIIGFDDREGNEWRLKAKSKLQNPQCLSLCRLGEVP